MVLLQGIKWFLSAEGHRPDLQVVLPEDPDLTSRLDSVRARLRRERAWVRRPLDPNYLDDYRGYLLGIPFDALDSLYAFRSRGGVVTGMEQFTRITGMDDSAMATLAPVLRFPKKKPAGKKKAPTNLQDLNAATADELMAVKGIGPVLSRRIVAFRNALGGFLSSAQLLDVYGLSPETANRVMEAFPLLSTPAVQRVDLNRATVRELSGILYLNRQMAGEIVAYRSRIGKYRTMDELYQVKGLPKDKIDRIALYLKL